MRIQTVRQAGSWQRHRRSKQVHTDDDEAECRTDAMCWLKTYNTSLKTTPVTVTVRFGVRNKYWDNEFSIKYLTITRSFAFN